MTRSRKAFARPLVLAALVVVVLLVALTRGGGTYQVTAVFQQAYGIVTGDDVWTGGGVVGTISAIRLGRDGLPRVTMRIDDSYRLHATGTAELEFGSNSGELNRLVMLSSGSGPPLADGAVIPVSRTVSPVELDDVLGTFAPATRADIRYVLTQLDGATSGLSGAFAQTLRHSARALGETSDLLDQVTSDGAALRTLVSQGDLVTATLASQDTALSGTVDSLGHLLSTTASRQTQLEQAVSEMPAGLRAPRIALDRLSDEIPTLKRVISEAKPTVAQLRPTSTLLARTLTVAVRPLAQIASTLRFAPPKLRSLGGLLKIVNPTVRQLTPVAGKLLPILDVVRVYTPEIDGFFSGWADMTSSYDAAGHAIHLVITTPPPDTIVPPTSNAPGYLAAPFQRTPGALIGEPWTDYEQSFLSDATAGNTK
jgi:virulence factor Mce-like protein